MSKSKGFQKKLSEKLDQLAKEEEKNAIKQVMEFSQMFKLMMLVVAFLLAAVWIAYFSFKYWAKIYEIVNSF